MKKRYKPGKYKPPKKEPLFTFKDFLKGTWDVVKAFIIFPLILLIICGFIIAIDFRWLEIFYGF